MRTLDERERFIRALHYGQLACLVILLGRAILR
jgi:hypothetical protein